MQKLFENWRKYLNESTGYGGDRPGIAGTMRNNSGFSTNIYDVDKDTGDSKDTKQVSKAVMIRNGLVILLWNEGGWDLPGGHMKQAENFLHGLEREVYEETGLNIIEPKLLHFKHENKKFFKGAFGAGEINLSDEHSRYGYFNLEDIKKFNAQGTLANEYLSAIEEALGGSFGMEE